MVELYPSNSCSKLLLLLLEKGKEHWKKIIYKEWSRENGWLLWSKRSWCPIINCSVTVSHVFTWATITLYVDLFYLFCIILYFLFYIVTINCLDGRNYVLAFILTAWHTAPGISLELYNLCWKSEWLTKIGRSSCGEY